MSDACSSGPCSSRQPPPPAYRRVLWVALVVNLAMFAVEIAAGWNAASAALLADAVDFFGDAANYAVSLFVLSMGLTARARAALTKGLVMGGYGLYVLGQAGWNALQGVSPDAVTMGVVGVLALTSNLAVAVLLYAFRDGDANMRSVWLCSRNDAIGNVAVLAAAAFVGVTATRWPDLGVAAVMAGLAVTAAFQIIHHARSDLRAGAVAA